MSVDCLLDKLTPEEFNERYAAYVISGEGDTQHFVARILAAIGNLLPSYATLKGAQDVPHRKIEDYLPQFLRPKKRQRPAIVTGEQLATQLGCFRE